MTLDLEPKLKAEGDPASALTRPPPRFWCVDIEDNDVSRMQFDEDLALAQEEHLRRCQLKWLVDWGAYRGHVEQIERARERKARK